MKIIQRNCFILFLLVLVFAAPGLFALFFYSHPTWLSPATTNKGTLLAPPIFLTSLRQDNKDKIKIKVHQGISTKTVDLAKDPKWQMILWSPSACEQQCLDELDKLARVRLALGRHLYEIESVLLMGANTPELSSQINKQLKQQDIRVLKLSSKHEEAALPSKFAIFIANPDNYLVLSYIPTVQPQDIFYDIKLLLKR